MTTLELSPDKNSASPERIKSLAARRRITWLLMAHVALLLAVPVLVSDLALLDMNTAATLALAIIFAQQGLLMLWIAFSASGVLYRILAAPVYWFFEGLLIRIFTNGEPRLTELISLLIPCFVTLAFWFLAYSLRITVSREPTQSVAGTGLPQFTVRQLLSITFVIAATLGVWNLPDQVTTMPYDNGLQENLLLTGCGAVVAFVASWAILRRRRLWIRSTICVSLSAALGAAAVSLPTKLQLPLQIAIGAMTLQALLAIASLLVIRTNGYRLHHASVTTS